MLDVGGGFSFAQCAVCAKKTSLSASHNEKFNWSVLFQMFNISLCNRKETNLTFIVKHAL